MLRKAQSMESKKISSVCLQGKYSFVSSLRKRSYCTTIVKPTSTPIMMPRRQEAKTSRRAS